MGAIEGEDLLSGCEFAIYHINISLVEDVLIPSMDNGFESLFGFEAIFNDIVVFGFGDVFDKIKTPWRKECVHNNDFRGDLTNVEKALNGHGHISIGIHFIVHLIHNAFKFIKNENKALVFEILEAVKAVDLNGDSWIISGIYGSFGNSLIICEIELLCNILGESASKCNQNAITERWIISIKQ